ncbi:hypothetical protein M885DRAFT_573421 [Pelagophyceae sp. CCMP2097]|nr:hypothetical protein M885DRAFT_573421 [Pelagophyceae sp. CCMP2097]
MLEAHHVAPREDDAVRKVDLLLRLAQQSQEAEAEMTRSPAIMAAHAVVQHQSAAKNKSHVTLFAKFECFVLAHMPETDYYAYLVKLTRAHAAREAGDVPEKVEYQAPSDDLVLVYAQVLRGNADGTSVIKGVEGGCQKHGTIKAAIGSIHATEDEFSPGSRGKVGPLLKSCLSDWVAEDKVNSAPAFDMDAHGAGQLVALGAGRDVVLPDKVPALVRSVNIATQIVVMFEQGGDDFSPIWQWSADRRAKVCHEPSLFNARMSQYFAVRSKHTTNTWCDDVDECKMNGDQLKRLGTALKLSSYPETPWFDLVSSLAKSKLA